VFNELSTAPWRRGNGGIDPSFLNSTLYGRWVVSVMPWPIYHQVKRSGTHRIGCWGAPQPVWTLCRRETFLAPVGSWLSSLDPFEFFCYKVKIMSSTTFITTILNQFIVVAKRHGYCLENGWNENLQKEIFVYIRYKFMMFIRIKIN
jgi:hypothetical protein